MDEAAKRCVARVDSDKRRLHRRRILLQYPKLVSEIWRRLGVGSYLARMHFEAVPYPQYAYGVYAAALQAKALGLAGITVCEFGVGFGNGLRALETAAIEIGKALDVIIDVAGFDVATGLPQTNDYRDAIYWYTPGYFSFDIEGMKKTLRCAELHIGPVRETIVGFMGKLRYPLGFISFDLDYYTSTCDALAVLRSTEEKRLPRVICYFDDLWGGVSDMTIFSSRIGQLESIRQFNEQLDSALLEPIVGLQYKRPIAAPWNEQMYVFNDFRHGSYNRRINPK